MKPDDSKLKEGLRKGDREIFKQLFLDYSAGLVRYGTTLTGDTEAARELVQDLFLEMWEKRQSLVIRGSVKPYLFSAIFHKGLNWIRAKKIREAYLQDPKNIHNWFGLPIDQEKLDPILLSILEHEILQLPEQCREVFSRNKIEGQKIGDIASDLGLNSKTVENHLSRARIILQKRIKKIL